MNRRWFTFLVSLFLAVGSLMAQEVTNDVAAAFKRSDAEAIGLYTNSETELMVSGEEKIIGSEAIVGALASIFKEKRANGFSVVHKGSREKSGFIIGTLSTREGAYRVNCFFKRLQDKYIIHQIRIDKING